MQFLQLHQKTQREIRQIKAKKAKLRAKQARQRAAQMQRPEGARIVGFANPAHDALFNLAVTLIRSLA